MSDVDDFIDSQYQCISLLGLCCQGYGTVELAKHRQSQKVVVVKRINLEKLTDEVELIENEIILTKQLCHPNIIKYLTSYVNGPDVCIVSPLMGFGSCRNVLNVHFINGLPENAIALITKDVLDALEYIHRRGIIHRAIRASHVLINESGSSCLSGFRYACTIVENGRWQRRLHSFPTSTARNLSWLSPELLAQNLQGYNEKSDVYSVGLLITELANGTEPFADMSTTLMLTEKTRGSAPQLLDCTTLPSDDDEAHGDSGLNMQFQKLARRKFSHGLHELTALCLQREPQGRPTAAQLITHPYFKVSRRVVHLPDLLRPAIPMGAGGASSNSGGSRNVELLGVAPDMRTFGNAQVPHIGDEWDF